MSNAWTTDRIIGVESSGNPYAKNPKSSALGLGQFINSTWLSTLRKHRPDLAGKPDAELLALRTDPNLSREMTAKHAQDNNSFLSAKGFNVTPGTTYLAHFAGPQGAVRALSNPNAPVEQILGEKAVAANPFLRGWNGQQLANWANAKIDGKPIMNPAGAAQPNTAQPTLNPANERFKALASAFMKQSMDNQPQGWGDFVRGLSSMYLGDRYGSVYDQDQKAYATEFGRQGQAATTPELARSLAFRSNNPELQEKALASQLKPKSTEYGKNIIYGKDADGNVIALQASDAGTIIQPSLPSGVKLAEPTKGYDTGTQFVLQGSKTGSDKGVISKDVAGKEEQEEIGKVRAQARASLPQVDATTRRVVALIDRLDRDPARKSFTGYSGYLPTVSPSANDYKARLDQVQGNAFLQAFNNLRGAGAITEVEGIKATAALTRLQQVAPSDKGFQEALDDAKAVMKEILENAKKRAELGINPSNSGPAQRSELPAVTNGRSDPLGLGL